jgi:MATE family multidrug resistance protein
MSPPPSPWRGRAVRALGAELPPLLRLAGPVVAAEIGWTTMWLVDTIIVGRLGAEAIGAVSIGGTIFFGVTIFGFGMLLGLDYVVATAVGAGRLRDAHRALVDGVWLAVAVGVVLTALLYGVIALLPATSIQPAVLAGGIPYLHATAWSLVPLLVFTAFRRYLQALGAVRPIMVAALTANVVNATACWLLVFGELGFPALGVAGSGVATTISRVYMLAYVVAHVVRRERRAPTGLFRRADLRPAWDRLRTLVGYGLPAAGHLTAEMGVVTVVTTLAARFEPAALAAHQIALTLASFTFMVPLGLSSAAAVRVGHAVGRGDARGAARAGWTALVLGLAFMSTTALTFLLAPTPILRVFTSDPRVLASGVGLLLIAAAFQLFDGAQVVLTGALRGTGDTRTPMVANLVGYWVIGLPVGCVLCFGRGVGVPGLWMGLCVGLVCVGLTLLVVWARRVGASHRGATEAMPATG